MPETTDHTSDDIDYVQATYELRIEGGPHVVATITTFFTDGESHVITGILRGIDAAEIAMGVLQAQSELRFQAAEATAQAEAEVDATTVV